MNFPLQFEESVAEGIKQGVRRQAKKACRELENLADDQAVHDLRKRFKRIRAVTRLVRPEIGDKSFRKLNEAIRDAGRALAPLRDARVLVSALGKLPKRHGHEINRHSLQPVERKLESDYQSIRAQFTVDHELRRRVVERLKDALREAKQWKFHGRGWRPVRAGLEETFELAQQAF